MKPALKQPFKYFMYKAFEEKSIYRFASFGMNGHGFCHAQKTWAFAYKQTYPMDWRQISLVRAKKLFPKAFR